MNSKTLYKELNYVNHSRQKRMQYAQLVLADLDLFPKLLDILFLVDNPVSCRAAWILEFVCGEKLEVIVPYLDTFTEQIGLIYLDPAVRPVAKICEYLAKAYTSKIDNDIKQALTHNHKAHIIEVCFDWMINDHKIAPKAYSMNTLYLLGKDYDWVYTELLQILERDFKMQSSGFKARAKHIIKKIQKTQQNL